MREPEFSGMQRLAVKLQFLQQLAVRLSGAAVNRIAEQWMTDRGHVHADLVGSASLEPAFDQRGLAQRLQSFPVSHRPLAASGLDNGDLLAVGCRASERGINDAAGRLRHPAD